MLVRNKIVDPFYFWILMLMLMAWKTAAIDQTGDLQCLGLISCPMNGNCNLDPVGVLRSAWFNKCNATLNFQLLDSTHNFVWLRIPPLDYPSTASYMPYSFDYSNFGIGSAVVSPPARPMDCAVMSTYHSTLMNRCQLKTRVLILQYCTAENWYSCNPPRSSKLTWVDMYGAEVGSEQNLINNVLSTSTFCPSGCTPHAYVVGQQ